MPGTGDGCRLLTLFNAVCSNDLFMLQEVLMESPQLDVNEAVMGLTALHIAAEKGYSSCVTVLLAAGACVDQQDEHGLTPLMTGIEADYPLVIHQLLRASASTNIMAHNTLTSMHFAARQGNNGVVNMLLASGASPNVQADATLESPLSIAVLAGYIGIVETLLLGSVYVNPVIFARCELNPLPLKRCIEFGEYAIAKLLIIAGYNALPEVSMGFKSADLKVLDSVEREERLFLTTQALTALPLQHHCRLQIRRSLQCDISNKVECLNLPQVVKDYVTYKHCHTPPNLNTDREIYDYFDDYAGDLH